MPLLIWWFLRFFANALANLVVSKGFENVEETSFRNWFPVGVCKRHTTAGQHGEDGS